MEKPGCLRGVFRYLEASVCICLRCSSNLFLSFAPFSLWDGGRAALSHLPSPLSANFSRLLSIQWEAGFLNEMGGDKESHPPPCLCPVHIPAATVSKFANPHPEPLHHVSSFMHGHLCSAARPVATQPTSAPRGLDISESKLTKGALIPHAKQPGRIFKERLSELKQGHLHSVGPDPGTTASSAQALLLRKRSKSGQEQSSLHSEQRVNAPSDFKIQDRHPGGGGCIAFYRKRKELLLCTEHLLCAKPGTKPENKIAKSSRVPQPSSTVDQL